MKFDRHRCHIQIRLHSFNDLYKCVAACVCVYVCLYVEKLGVKKMSSQRVLYSTHLCWVNKNAQWHIHWIQHTHTHLYIYLYTKTYTNLYIRNHRNHLKLTSNECEFVYMSAEFSVCEPKWEKWWYDRDSEWMSERECQIGKQEKSTQNRGLHMWYVNERDRDWSE